MKPYQPVLDFWFANQPNWFAKSADFDRQIISRFSGLHKKAAAGELSARCESLDGRLAEIRR